MSTIRYDQKDMIDCLASCWAYGSAASTDGKRKLAYLAEVGNRILEANREAYNATYEDDAAQPEPLITASMIDHALIRKTVDTNLRGRRVLEGLRYNMIANDGRDFGTAEVLDDLLALFRNTLTLVELRSSRSAA